MSDQLDFTSNWFTFSHNLTLDLLLAVNVRADTVTMCCTNLSYFIPQKRTLSKVKFIQVGLSKVCQQSVSICCVIQRTDKQQSQWDRGEEIHSSTHIARVHADHTVAAPGTVHIAQGFHGNAAWPHVTFVGIAQGKRMRTGTGLHCPLLMC